jgi:hypothetical protein
MTGEDIGLAVVVGGRDDRGILGRRGIVMGPTVGSSFDRFADGLFWEWCIDARRAPR